MCSCFCGRLWIFGYFGVCGLLVWYVVSLWCLVIVYLWCFMLICFFVVYDCLLYVLCFGCVCFDLVWFVLFVVVGYFSSGCVVSCCVLFVFCVDY